MIKINDLRISWIWTETFRELIVNPPRLKSQWGNLGSDLEYEPLFGNLQGQQNALSAPWDTSNPKHIHYFWKYYLEKENCAQVSPTDAFRKLVPLRLAHSPRLKTPWTSGKLVMEAFVYSHGIARVITLHLKEQLPLNDLVDRAVAAAQNATFEVTWKDEPSVKLTLPQMASDAMARLRSFVYGSKVSQGVSPSKPFTVATVVRGEGVDKNVPNVEGDEVHRALEGLCGWHATWNDDVPHPLKERSLEIRHAPVSHSLYSLTRGRAVWFPASFLDTPHQKTSLACYHRNLMFASLQTESLAGLMQLAEQLYKNPVPQPPMTGPISLLIESAAEILGKLYAGDMSTYRSSSPTAQMKDNKWVNTINYVRSISGKPPL